MLESVNPANGEVIFQVAPHDGHYINDALAKAVEVQTDWRRRPLDERISFLPRLADVLRENKHRYAVLISIEMGKPIGEAIAEIEKCAWNCDYYAENAKRFLEPEIVETPARESYVSFDPLGLILAIMPWNYPFWQAFRCLVPIIVAGNGYVLKHASNVPQSALAIEEIVRKAGLPEHLVTTLLVGSKDVKGLIEHPAIAAVTLTGSTQAGAVVAAQAGAHIKRQVLELGGSDPFIVLADADLEAAAATALKARFHNAGQSCISPKRFIVEASAADRFAEALVAGIDKIVVGDPMAPGVGMGPMARKSLRNELHGIVEATVGSGGRLIRGGQMDNGAGAFYPATFIDHVTPGMAIFNQEAFGPAASLVRARDAHHAIELANMSEYGLSGALWTSDIERGKDLARQLDLGAVFINAMVASDPRMPFGGIKRSGYGRELGREGIREFTNIKTNWIG